MSVKSDTVKNQAVKSNNRIDVVESPSGPNDLALFALLLIANLASGAMSYWGALAFFDKPLLAIAFTLVVQGVLMMTLWSMTGLKGLRLLLVVGIWAMAVSFSIGTAFVHADRQNDVLGVNVAKQEVANLFPMLKEPVLSLRQRAVDERLLAAEERSRGGCGRICNTHVAAAVQHDNEADVLEAQIGSVIATSAKSLEDLTVKATLGDVLAIYNNLKIGAGAAAQELQTPPALLRANASAMQRFKEGLVRISNFDGVALITLWGAALMELLSLGIGVTRRQLKAQPSERSLIDRINAIGAWIVGLKHLRSNVDKMSDHYANIVEAQEQPKPTPKPARKKPAANKEEENFWEEALRSQAQQSNLTVSEMPSMLLELLADTNAAAPLDTKLLKEQPLIRSVLNKTKVTVLDEKNVVHTTQKFDLFTSFLWESSKRANEALVSDRKGKPGLRRVA